jgi:hypothetical protein
MPIHFQCTVEPCSKKKGKELWHCHMGKKAYMRYASLLLTGKYTPMASHGSSPLLPDSIADSNNNSHSHHPENSPPPAFQAFQSDNDWGNADDALSHFLAESEHPPQAHWGYAGDALDKLYGLDVRENQGGVDEPLEHSAAPASLFHTHSLKHDWGSTDDDALRWFIHQLELSDDAHALMLASPSLTRNDAMDLPEISTQEVDIQDSDGSGYAGMRSPSPLQLEARSDSPPRPTSNSDPHGGWDDEPSYKPFSKPSPPVPEDPAALTSLFHAHGSEHDWGRTDDALAWFLHQSEHLADDVLAEMLTYPSAIGNNKLDLQEITTQEVDIYDSNGSGDVEIHSSFPSQLVARSESPLRSTSNSDVDGGSNYEPPTYEPLSQPSTPVLEDDHPLPRLSYSKEELYIGEPPTF